MGIESRGFRPVENPGFKITELSTGETDVVQRLARVRRQAEQIRQSSVLDHSGEGSGRPTTEKLAPAVSVEKAKFLVETFGQSQEQKRVLLSTKEKELARDEFLIIEAGKRGGIDPGLKSAYLKIWAPYGSEKALRESVEPRKQAYKELREELNKASRSVF
ncbi:MAG: hypothetical protein V1716_03565 [Candidatus Uhrbacteria bacterium]